MAKLQGQGSFFDLAQVTGTLPEQILVKVGSRRYFMDVTQGLAVRERQVECDHSPGLHTPQRQVHVRTYVHVSMHIYRVPAPCPPAGCSPQCGLSAPGNLPTHSWPSHSETCLFIPRRSFWGSRSPSSLVDSFVRVFPLQADCKLSEDLEGPFPAPLCCLGQRLESKLPHTKINPFCVGRTLSPRKKFMDP